MHTTTNPAIAAAADQTEAVVDHVRRLTSSNRLLADPEAGDRYIIECLSENLRAQESTHDYSSEQNVIGPRAVARIVRADHAEGEGGWPPAAGVTILEDAARAGSVRSSDICYRCLDPLRRVPARLQPCRTLWIGKGTYIAEFHFCEANCVPYFERIFPTIEWKVDARAV
jgi:hypothetical protein